MTGTTQDITIIVDAVFFRFASHEVALKQTFLLPSILPFEGFQGQLIALEKNGDELQ